MNPIKQVVHLFFLVGLGLVAINILVGLWLHVFE